MIFATTPDGANGSVERMRIHNAGLVDVKKQFKVSASDGTLPNIMSAQIQNLEATDGQSFGLSLNAGSNASDIALNVTDHDGSNALLRVFGNGAITVNGGQAGADFKVESDGNANMFVVNAGANGVGIGTDNQSTRELKVNNASNQSDITITSGANQSAQLLFGDQDADNQGIIQYNNNGDTMHFFVDGTERFAIDDGLTFEGQVWHISYL